jgi:hypothetical protein
VLLSLAAVLVALFGGRRDPVVNDKPMSEWAFGLIEQPFRKNSYYVTK